MKTSRPAMRGRRRAAAALVLSMTLGPAAAWAAPAGEHTVPLTVLELAADDAHETDAQALTNELRQAVLESTEHSLPTLSPSVGFVAERVRCDTRALDRPGPEADRSIDEACQRRMATRLGARRLLWGHLYEQAGVLYAKVHLFREDKAERVVTVSYERAQQARVAKRVYAKLVTPERVGDVRVQGDATFAGAELFTSGVSLGAFAPGLELTVASGPLELEARRDGRVLARAKATVAAERMTEARLVFVPRTDLDPTAGFRDPLPVTVTPRRSAWPWVLGGVGVAGLAGAGVFLALRRGQENDLDTLCGGGSCPPRADDTLDRSKRYGTLSLVSLGVGLAGVAASSVLFLTEGKRRAGPAALQLEGGFLPVLGGGVAALGGHF